MRVYQLSYMDQHQEHRGFTYFGSKAAAKKEAKRAKSNGVETTELVLWVEISKAGILRALNTYGGHPDNG
jgi:hypothetical protein